MTVQPQHQQIQVDRILLTPIFARELLALNLPEDAPNWEEGKLPFGTKIRAYERLHIGNRKISEQWVHNLARYITDGQWIFDANSIRVGTKNGKTQLLDGQHRCLACIEANKPIDTLYIRGLDFSAQLVMDTNKRRNFANYLQLQDPPIPSSTAIAGLVRFTLGLENNYYPMRGDAVHRLVFSNPELLARYQKEEDLFQEAVRISNNVYRGLKLNRTAYAAFWMQVQALDREDADDFTEKITHGTNLPEGSPIISLRRQLSTATDNKFRFNWYQYALIVKAWNAYRDGRSVGFLTYRPGGKANEKMPEPH